MTWNELRFKLDAMPQAWLQQSVVVYVQSEDKFAKPIRLNACGLDANFNFRPMENLLVLTVERLLPPGKQPTLEVLDNGTMIVKED